MKKSNIKKVEIDIPSIDILKRIQLTPAFKNLSRLQLQVGKNIENVNHTQYSRMIRLYPIMGVSVKEIKQ